MKKLILLITFFLFNFTSTFADKTYFIDFNKVLNNSKAGAQAQKNLKVKFENEAKKFKKQSQELKKEETDIISQKKVITSDDYKKKVQVLRKKVATLQENKQESFERISNSRAEAKEKLLKAINPILKKYMTDNNVRMIVDKKIVLMGDSNLEITDQIISILNKELSCIKIN